MAKSIIGDRAAREATQAGADAFLGLMRAIKALSIETHNRYNDDKDGNPGSEDIDGRDYPAMVAATRASVTDNLIHADQHHIAGYMRAMADLLCIVADGCHPGDDWRPLQTTEPAFVLARLASTAR